MKRHANVSVINAVPLTTNLTTKPACISAITSVYPTLHSIVNVHPTTSWMRKHAAVSVIINVHHTLN